MFLVIKLLIGKVRASVMYLITVYYFVNSHATTETSKIYEEMSKWSYDMLEIAVTTFSGYALKKYERHCIA